MFILYLNSISGSFTQFYTLLSVGMRFEQRAVKLLEFWTLSLIERFRIAKLSRNHLKCCVTIAFLTRILRNRY